MNITTLIFHALATERALKTGRSDDPGLMDLSDAIFAISGADECAFGACTGNVRNFFFEPTISDYIVTRGLVPESYNWIEYGDLFDGGRAFTLGFNNSLPEFRDVLATCARADLPTVFEIEGDGMKCFNGKNKFNVTRETFDGMLRYYHNTLDYNACLGNAYWESMPEPEVACLVEVFGLDDYRLKNAARASRQVQLALERRLMLLQDDIADAHSTAANYINSHVSNTQSSGYFP